VPTTLAPPPTQPTTARPLLPPQIRHPYVRKLFRGRRGLARIAAGAIATRLIAERWIGELLGVAVLGRRWLSDVPPRQVIRGIPMGVDRRLRLILMLRGLTHDNHLFRRAAARDMATLLRAVAAANPLQHDQPLPELAPDQLTEEQFHGPYVRNPHPVVVRGGARQIVDWTVGGLIERFPETPVLMSSYETGENFSRPLRELATWRDADGRPAYVHNCERLLADHPELYAELDLHGYADLLRMPYHCAQVFLGLERGSGTPFHCANNFNVFLQVEGRKRWTFVDPNYTMFLYPYLSTGNAYQACAVGYPDDPRRMESMPLYRYCPRYRVDLEPGDMLLNPPWWYHAVENLTETTVGVSTRWLGPFFSPHKDTNHLYTFLQFWNGRLLLPLLRIWTDLLAGDPDVAAMHREKGPVHKDRTLFEDESHDDGGTDMHMGTAIDAWRV